MPTTSERPSLAVFADDRHEIIATASELPPAPKKSLDAIVKQRAEKAVRDLARWGRKLKLARTKVAKLKRKVKYYRKNNSIS